MQRVIHLDLPSKEIPRERGTFDGLREMLGKPPPKGSGLQRMTLSTLAVIEGLAEGLRTAGIDDVVRFEVDGEVIFNDAHDIEGDLPFILTQALGAGLLDRAFAQMALHVRDEVAGARLDLVAKVSAESSDGYELKVHCASSHNIDAKALDGRVEAIARALAGRFGGVRWRIAR